MKDFKLFSYIRKCWMLIVLSSLVMGMLFYSYFSGKQTYTASAIIQYKNAEAVNGLAPDGTKIDVTEIYSAEVMTKVFEKLGLNYSENNIDAIRAGIRVVAEQSKEESAVQEALNEKGEVSEEKPTMYRVSYTIRSKDVQDAAAFSKQILKVMLDTYAETYAENHVNSQIELLSTDGIYSKDYDYIEMVELLDSSVERAMEHLSYNEYKNFRSAQTGYTFYDLRQEFSMLERIDIPNAYQYVLGNQVTKDQDVLISKYENRITNAMLQNNVSTSEIRGVDEVIQAYVEMMRNSNNTDFTYEYILGDVYESYYSQENETRKKADVTTEYDALMNNYVRENVAYEYTLIDIAYNKYILDVFSGNLDESGSASVQVVENPEAGVEKVEGQETESTSRKVIVSSPESQERANEIIKALNDKVDRLYQMTLLTNSEYNRFAGAENIAVMTDAVSVPALNLFVYALLAVFLFGVIGCVAAVVVGRTLEIINYYVFVDKKLNIANRAGCDRYISKYTKRPLPDQFVCISIKILDIEKKNKAFGREACDAAMVDFCAILRDVLPSELSFIAKNDVGHFIIFLRDSSSEQAHAYMRDIGKRCTSYNRENPCTISYYCGISSSTKNQIYEIRKLMVESINLSSKTVMMKNPA